MEEKRYSLRAAGKMIGKSAMTVVNRAVRLGINTECGLTAADVKAIMELKPKGRYAKRATIEELREELEGLK